MTKKHFEAFAREIKRQKQQSSSNETHLMCLSQFVLVCNIAKQFNSGFDTNRFLKACGLDGQQT